jgi:hypothetical protein
MINRRFDANHELIGSGGDTCHEHSCHLTVLRAEFP